MVMMQLCEEKHCWLYDLDDIPSQELAKWIAYYQIQEENRKRNKENH